jgi:hypothetical protein
LVGENSADHHKAIDHHDIGLALLLIDELRKADSAARTGHVLDRDALGAASRHDLCQRASRLIPAASRLGGGNDPEIVHGLCGACGQTGCGHHREGQKGRAKAASDHRCLFPVIGRTSARLCYVSRNLCDLKRHRVFNSRLQE